MLDYIIAGGILFLAAILVTLIIYWAAKAAFTKE